MNTIKRKIIKERQIRTDKPLFETDTITFEGEKGKFYVSLEHYNPFEGTRRTDVGLDKEDAEILYNSLKLFLR